ncbi:uncharacterized protein V1510DRAFT_432361 [Dipodascopsis tothii]|uniref:uncharacterized protein n=1 Tax=Dipodascopsis tothii TaxID=44089 RepID=UPI0034CFBD8A
MILSGLCRPVHIAWRAAGAVAGLGRAAAARTGPSALELVRGKHKMKTHKATLRRWIPLGSGGFKRAAPGLNHGNTGWSRRYLQRRGRTGYAIGGSEPGSAYSRRLRRLLPNA